MKMRMAGAILLASCGAAAVAAQQEGPGVTFRVEVNYVEVDAVVTDASGRIVTDLTQADFEVLEDGRPQKVAAFSLVNLPIERQVRPLFAGAPIEPDVGANTIAEGRIYMLVLDDLHTNFTSTARVRRFLRDFVENNFGANDLAAIVYTSGRATAGQEFTSRRRLLLEAIDRFSGRRLRSEALEMADELSRRTDSSLDPTSDRDLTRLDPLEAERAHEARSMLSSLRDLAAFMEGIRGRRKAMLLISEVPEALELDERVLSAERCIDALRLMKVCRRIDEVKGELADAQRANDELEVAKLAQEQIELERLKIALLPTAGALQMAN